MRRTFWDDNHTLLTYSDKCLPHVQKISFIAQRKLYFDICKFFCTKNLTCNNSFTSLFVSVTLDITEP